MTTTHRQIFLLLVASIALMAVTTEWTSAIGGVYASDETTTKKRSSTRGNAAGAHIHHMSAMSTSSVTRTGAQEAVMLDTTGMIYDDDEDDGDASSESSFSNVTSPAPDDTSVQLGADMGEPQTISESHGQDILDKIVQDRIYMQQQVYVDPKYEHVKGICKNQHEQCTFWALIGECDANPGYMKINCAPACRTCEQLDINLRCPKDPNAVDALQNPGDLDDIFERIISTPEFEVFEPIVVSRPPDGPWLIMFENFLLDEEAERLIELGGQLGYERSTNVGKKKLDGTHEKKVSSTRTSMNTWCQRECDEDKLAQQVVGRIENVTGIPSVNSENLQLLRYETGQFYNTHSDYIPDQIDRPTGVRILTFYCYLNDVENGGGTKFPDKSLNITVQPKRGRAVLWPSVLNEAPNEKDARTVHEAMPVGEGSVKFGANAWLHMRDFKTNNKKGC